MSERVTPLGIIKYELRELVYTTAIVYCMGGLKGPLKGVSLYYAERHKTLDRRQ